MKSIKDMTANAMENISSKSKNLNFKDPVDLYGKFVYKNLGRVIKFTAYVVAILTFAAGLAFVFLIGLKQVKYIIVALAVLLISAALALIEFFIIYGIGHVIDQNNEILKRLS